MQGYRASDLYCITISTNHLLSKQPILTTMKLPMFNVKLTPLWCSWLLDLSLEKVFIHKSTMTWITTRIVQTHLLLQKNCHSHSFRNCSKSCKSGKESPQYETVHCLRNHLLHLHVGVTTWWKGHKHPIEQVPWSMFGWMPTNNKWSHREVTSKGWRGSDIDVSHWTSWCWKVNCEKVPQRFCFEFCWSVGNIWSDSLFPIHCMHMICSILFWWCYNR